MMSLQPMTADLVDGGAQYDALTALHHRTVDVLAGYDKMVEKAEPSFKPVVEAFQSLHATQAQQIARILLDLGQDIDADGTLMGTVNVAVVSLRALFDDIDAGIMDKIRDGEASVLLAFDDAVQESPDAATTTALTQMRADLVALLDRTQHLG